MVWDTGMVYPATGVCGIGHLSNMGFDISITIDALNSTTGNLQHPIPIAKTIGRRNIANCSHVGPTGPPAHSGPPGTLRPPPGGVKAPLPGDAADPTDLD